MAQDAGWDKRQRRPTIHSREPVLRQFCLELRRRGAFRKHEVSGLLVSVATSYRGRLGRSIVAPTGTIPAKASLFNRVPSGPRLCYLKFHI